MLPEQEQHLLVLIVKKSRNQELWSQGTTVEKQKEQRVLIICFENV